MSGNWTLERLQSSSYRDLQLLARENGLKANAKKLDLVAQLTQILVNKPSIPSLQDEELMDFDQTADTTPLSPAFCPEEITADSTHLNDMQAPPSDELYLTADESTTVDENATRDLEPASDTKEDDTYSVEEPTIEQPPVINATSARQGRSQVPRRGINSERFAESHKRIFDKMETIHDAQAKLEQKHRDLMGSVNERVHRLATPKNAREPVRRRFRTPNAPQTEDFKFGSVPAERIEKIQKPIPPPEERPLRPVRRAIRVPGEDIKTMTIKQSKEDARTDTRTPDLRRIEQLATPKSAGAIPVPKDRKSFTPKKAPYRYVDTTKMSNAEFREYQRQQKQEQNRRDKMLL